jgi:hypothetical protein
MIFITASRNALSSQLDGTVGFAPPLIRILKKRSAVDRRVMARSADSANFIFLKRPCPPLDVRTAKRSPPNK